MTKRADAVDKLGEALNEIRGVWTPEVRKEYDNVAKQFRKYKTQSTNLKVYKDVALEYYRPVLQAIYTKLNIELPVEFVPNKEIPKLMAELEKLRMGQRLGS